MNVLLVLGCERIQWKNVLAREWLGNKISIRACSNILHELNMMHIECALLVSFGESHAKHKVHQTHEDLTER